MIGLSEYISGSKIISNSQLYRALKKRGLEKYKLCKAKGYFYITSDDVDTANQIATWYDNAIYVYGFNQQSVEDWVRDIIDIIDKNKKGA